MIKTIIDIGSNSIKYLCVDADLIDYQILEYSVFANRITNSILINKSFTQTDINSTIQVLLRIKECVAQYNCSSFKVIATMAFRMAENRLTALAEIKKQTGFSVQILSQDEEAFYSYNIASKMLTDSSKPSLIFNLGGGSLEIILSNNSSISCQTSFILGASIIKNMYFQSNSNLDSIAQAKSVITSKLSILNTPDLIYCVGMGGILSSLIKILTNNSSYDFKRFDSFIIRYADLELLESLILSGNLSNKLTLVSDSHRDLVLPGIVILLSIMESFHVNELINCEKGLCFAFITNQP